MSTPVAQPQFAEREGQLALDLPGGHVLFTGAGAGDLGPPPERPDLLARLTGTAPEGWVQVQQVHGAGVHVVADIGEADDVPAADAVLTDVRGVVCIVRVADCLPIALVAPQAVGVIHAGWRGLAAGVVASAVDALRGLGADDIRAALGPCARVCCYETGEEVHALFAGLGPGVRRGSHADLPAVARALLAEAGVTQVVDTGRCTICSPEGTYWSYRRQGAAAGRQGGVVWRS